MNQIDYENLGSRMKELRIKMKLTQAEVAKALNVTPGYISNVEKDRKSTRLNSSHANESRMPSSA